MAQGRTPQDPFRATPAHQVGDVRAPPADLLEGELAVATWYVFPEEAADVRVVDAPQNVHAFSLLSGSKRAAQGTTRLRDGFLGTIHGIGHAEKAVDHALVADELRRHARRFEARRVCLPFVA